MTNFIIKLVLLPSRFKKGDVIDGYGVFENYMIAKNENLLPMGLAEESIITKD